MGTLYDQDLVAWADRQAALLRAGQWSQLDIDNIAEEIEDVGRSERQGLRHRMIVSLVHLLKWTYQPLRRGASWKTSICVQRDLIEDSLEDYPSLRTLLNNPEWVAVTYRRAVRQAKRESGLKAFPAELPWTLTEVLNTDFFPVSKFLSPRLVAGTDYLPS